MYIILSSANKGMKNMTDSKQCIMIAKYEKKKFNKLLTHMYVGSYKMFRYQLKIILSSTVWNHQKLKKQPFKQYRVDPEWLKQEKLLSAYQSENNCTP